ncbi:aspartate-semialdehyde dehydrogenase [Paenactinomyces guangxiensis]|uniref:Aspartate-semialdehyde dehydrogenase n=1 Tax=Paenactinomyces guangxiensis TaxID=1490290 RepID=A0A7W2A8P7_9BACL|nr:aspartate-semialdehyde dehydrogenase [Paenactinomyces guangxiensis]MBA4494387.1 aspartate-semialdehyde dehydrogenase [Paenactinomyces guangxiensis]MBH8591558.1 aspartate-semialdehyde dehydrogenase [Paenactinomyces guangxiensis]
MSSQGYTVAVVGATGAVGQQMMRYLAKREFPVKELRPLASARSAGQKVIFHGEEVVIQEAVPTAFDGVDIALFSAGGSVSEKLAPEAVARGAVVIDNTNAYRMNPDVPLVVPEVNREAIRQHKGIIANPNCSTIQMVVALKPLYDRYGIERVIVSTYQSVSGAGWQAIDELQQQSKALLNGEEISANILPVGKLSKHYQMAFNVIPQIDVAQENGFTLEEMKMVRETKKIFNDSSIGVTATCVRVPVMRGHSESVYVELKSEFDLDEVRQLLNNAPGVIVEDAIEEQVYPMPVDAADRPEVFVGRIRRDFTHPRALNLWVVSDNLLKGAATNAIQIAEALISEEK